MRRMDFHDGEWWPHFSLKSTNRKLVASRPDIIEPWQKPSTSAGVMSHLLPCESRNARNFEIGRLFDCAHNRLFDRAHNRLPRSGPYKLQILCAEIV